MTYLALALTLLLAPIATPQADLSALFESGKEWTPWLEGVNAQQATWKQVTSQVNPPPALVERLRKAGSDLKILVVAEPACSDSVQSVPHIAKLAELAGVPLRIVAKAAAGQVYATHKGPEGQELTPTIVLLRAGKDAGAWIERPEALATWYRTNRSSIERGELLQRKTAWYQWDRGTSSMNEIVALAEKR
jgi:Thioredoxin